MSIRDFHERLEAEDKDELFAALAELRRVESLSEIIVPLAWPDWFDR